MLHLRSDSNPGLALPFLICLGIATALPPATAAAAAAAAEKIKPSFDCAKARSSAEKRICADPRLAEQDALIAQAYKQALKLLDDSGRKALKSDQADFAEARNEISEIADVSGDSQQTVQVDDLMTERAAFLAGIEKPPVEKFSGAWKNFRGSVKITPVDGDQLHVEEKTANQVTGGGVCGIDSVVPIGKSLKIPDTDVDNKNTSYTVRRDGDRLIVELPDGDFGQSQLCGVGGSVEGTFFFSKAK